MQARLQYEYIATFRLEEEIQEMLVVKAIEEKHRCEIVSDGRLHAVRIHGLKRCMSQIVFLMYML